ncbi:hypothetical protein RSAG8_13157, partial [Rhizoctonia solani AG-8 WAC10335]
MIERTTRCGDMLWVKGRTIVK